MNRSSSESYFDFSLDDNNINIHNNYYSSNTHRQYLQKKIKHEYNYANKNYGLIKNLPSDGIPLENVITNEINLIPNLTCCICLNLFWKPMFNLKCNDVFCKSCIEKSLKKVGNQCPLCKINTIKLYPAKFLNRFFNDIKIKCINNPCEETPQYSDYQDHLINKCKYRKYYCLNKGCSFKGFLNKIESHSITCINRIISCKFCNKEMKAKEYENHIKTECKNELKCKKCQYIMTRAYYTSVHKSECDNDSIDIIKVNKSIRNQSSSYIGYILSNNYIGAYFNDDTKIILDPKTNIFEFIEKKEGNIKEIKTIYTLYNYPTILSKKITIFNMIKAFFEAHFLNTVDNNKEKYKEKEMTQEEYDYVYVKKWKNVKNIDIFRLSNNVSQIIFQDEHVEIILDGQNKRVIYKNEKGQNYIYPMNDVTNSNNEIFKKIKYGFALLCINYN